jgi:hypothetical protein
MSPSPARADIETAADNVAKSGIELLLGALPVHWIGSRGRTKEDTGPPVT